MKRTIILIAAVLFVFCFAACSRQDNTETTLETETTQENTTAEVSSEAEETTEETLEEEDTTETEKLSFEESVNYGRNTGTDKTKTGFEPLSLLPFRLPEEKDYSSLSKDRREYGYGVGSNGEPPQQSLKNQKYMDENGFNALCLDTKSEEKVLYLTFDAGYTNEGAQDVLDILKEEKIPAAFFFTQPELEDNADTVAMIIKEGHIVGNHSVHHTDFSQMTADEIIYEVKTFDDYMRENFGFSSSFFRYPQGKYSEFSQAVLDDLGFTTVFWSLAYADWDINNQPSEKEALETVTARLHPGAVILLHASAPVNVKILPGVIEYARGQGYEFASLSDYK